ncbi:Protein O-mannosyltransferase 2 [Entomophthora muscae]|uniref:Protein O-mannosyltransferase 2 n=1 Tax=Entomophthora muscae TaxID=34485 RepID=A0ACC2SKI9_9FUNG|nr:Protein O-mannosyltransferase 2 [Entomophthora muscae]
MSETRINRRRTYAKNDRNYSLSPPESPNSPLTDLTPDDKESKINWDDNGKANEKQLWAPFKQLDNLAGSKKDEKAYTNSKKNERWLLLFITVISLATRWYKAGWGDRTIWDEAYFGKYGLNYVKHEFFHDVHPPLGKLLVGLSGKLAGYTGDFTFDSGVAFPKDLDHGFMRMFASAFGAAIVPFGYLTTKFVGLSLRCRLLTSVLLLFDNGFIVISKFYPLGPFFVVFHCWNNLRLV